MRNTLRGIPARALSLLGGVAVGALLLAGGPPAAVAQEGGQAAQQEVEGKVYRVGLSEEFTALLESNPDSANWENFRQAVGVRYETDEPERTHLVLHVLQIQGGEIQEHYTSDPFEVLPGAWKFAPDQLLPEESLIPSGYRISDVMGFGVIEIPAEEFMDDLLREIIAPMTEQAPGLYMVATPPEEERGETLTAYPVLVQTIPAGG